jgi:dihydropteroate synthase
MTGSPTRLRGLPRQPRALIMGVLNVTPDSFSDGGRWMDPAAAIEHGRALAAAGADIVDVGGESTRPGAGRVSATEELRRIMPVISALAASGSCVSVDTMRAGVAREAVEAGALMINDVSGGLADPQMARVAAAAGVPYVISHWRSHSADMYGQAAYRDVVAEVRGELARRAREVTAAGVDPAQLIVDPGVGFAKLAEHNWAVLAGLPDIACLPGWAEPFPLLVAASRKGFIGRLLTGPDGEPRPFSGSDDATVALTALAAGAGAWCVRVHSVRGNADAARVSARWREAGGRVGHAAPAGLGWPA